MFIEKIKCLDWKDIGIRALKTFIQTFLACFTIDGIFEISSAEELKSFLLSLLIAATASAVSATWNFATNYIAEQITDNDELEASMPNDETLDESEGVTNG